MSIIESVIENKYVIIIWMGVWFITYIGFLWFSHACNEEHLKLNKRELSIEKLEEELNKKSKLLRNEESDLQKQIYDLSYFKEQVRREIQEELDEKFSKLKKCEKEREIKSNIGQTKISPAQEPEEPELSLSEINCMIYQQKIKLYNEKGNLGWADMPTVNAPEGYSDYTKRIANGEIKYRKILKKYPYD